MPRARLPSLPPDVWFKVMCHLPAGTLHSISQTCKTLHQIAMSEALFQHYHTAHHSTSRQAPLTHTWREIHRRMNTIRHQPTYECFRPPVTIIPITPVADSLLVHIPSQGTLHAFPHTWSLSLSFLRGRPDSAVPLADFRVAIIDSSNAAGSPTRLHIIDSRDGSLRSHDLPPHPKRLSRIPGRKELLLPAEDFTSLVYYPGVLRVIKIADLSTFDIPAFEQLLVGESPHPLIEGYTTEEAPTTIYSLRGELLTVLPLPPGDKLLTLATNERLTSFTARIHRGNAIVALTRSPDGDSWTHIHTSHIHNPPAIAQLPNDTSPVEMFYNGTRTMLLPGKNSPRMTIMQTGAVVGLHTIRAARVRGAPFDSGGVAYGGDVVMLCAKRVGVVSLFDLDTGNCLRSLRFFRGRVDDVFFVGGAWIVGWRNGGCVFECWRFGVGELFGTANEILDNVGSFTSETG